MKRKILSAFALCFSVIAASAAPNTVQASKFGYNTADATGALQSAIDSGAKTVIIDDTGSEWRVGPIRLRSDLELVVGENVVLAAKEGAFNGQLAFLLAADECRNLVIRGEKNAVLRMDKKEYQDPARCRPSEWRHAVSLRGCTDVTVRDLIIDGSGGDGVYVGATPKQAGCRNILLENLDIRNHHRQAISIISAENLLIRHCKLRLTAGTPPACGIDFEPNSPHNFLVNCRIEDCEITGNDNYGILFVFSHLNRESRPVSITIADSLVNDNRRGGVRSEACLPGRTAVTGSIDFRNCRIETGSGEGIRFNNQSADGVRIAFRDCSVSSTAKDASPVVISSKLHENFGNIDLGNLAITDNLSRSAVHVSGLGTAGIASLDGKPTVVLGKGQAQPVDLEKLKMAHKVNPDANKFMPRPFVAADYLGAVSAEKSSSVGKPVKLRGNGRFFQCLKAGQKAVVSLLAEPVNPAAGKPNVTVEIADANGAIHGKIVLGTAPVKYELRADRDAVYVFEFNSTSHTVTIGSDMPGGGYPADSQLALFRSGADFYFAVEPEAAEVSFLVQGEVQESLKAILYDADGKPVAGSNKAFDGARLFSVPRKPAQKMEIWHLRMYDVVEDCSVRIGAPQQPVLFTSPGTVVVPNRNRSGR